MGIWVCKPQLPRSVRTYCDGDVMDSVYVEIMGRRKLPPTTNTAELTHCSRADLLSHCRADLLSHDHKKPDDLCKICGGFWSMYCSRRLLPEPQLP